MMGGGGGAGAAPQSPWAGVPSPAGTQGPVTGRHGLPLQTSPKPRKGWLGREIGSGSDLMMQLGRAGMGLGSGLLSTRRGENWGGGMSRGIRAGTEEFLSEGRRQRANTARAQFQNMASQGGPNADVFGLMASLEPGQMVPLASAAIAARGKTNPYAMADYRSGLAEDRKLGAEERKAATPADQHKQMVELFRAAKYNPAAREQLVEMGYLKKSELDGTTLPKQLQAVIDEDDRRSQMAIFKDRIDGDINASTDGSTPGGAPPLMPPDVR